MEMRNLLNEMEEKDPTTQEADTKEGIRVLINSDSMFKGRISRPVVVSFKFKDLAAALSDAAGITINRSKAKAMFDAFKQTMGL